MGVSGSIELQEGFTQIPSWPWLRTATIIKSYTDGEYDFCIDFALIMTLTGMSVDEAKAMIRSHAKNDTGIINALTFMVTLICLSEGDRRNEVGRFTHVFDLFDFNRTSSISVDELAIMLLCVASSFAFILGRASDLPSDSSMIEFAHAIYSELGKKKTAPITKDELLTFITDRLFKSGVLSIDALFERFCQGPQSVIREVVQDNKKGK